MFVTTLVFVWDTLDGAFEDTRGYLPTCNLTGGEISCVIVCDLGRG